MYHYVRPIKKSLYPLIKGLELNAFKMQLNYLEKNYKIITMESLIEFAKNDKSLPENPCLLTFDDGYKDHYSYVFPELKKRGIQGSFFPPAKGILEKKVLDVHKIHFILAKTENKNLLIVAAMDRKKLIKARKNIDKVDSKIFNLIKKRTKIVDHMLSLKKQKSQIVDRKRINVILKNLKNRSIKDGIDPKITIRIWKSMIWSYVDYQRKNFKRK